MRFKPAPDEVFFDALRGEDALGAVVRAHIHIEARLNEVLEALVPHPRHLPNVRFEQRAKLAVAIGLTERALEPLLCLGRIRNAFAHRLDVTLTNEMVEELQGSFSPEDLAVMQRAYAMTHEQLRTKDAPPFNKLDARSKFISLAVGLDKFLIDAHREAIESIAS